MPIARINDHRMYYEIHGEGEPVICVGGHDTSARLHEITAPTRKSAFAQSCCRFWRGIEPRARSRLILINPRPIQLT